MMEQLGSVVLGLLLLANLAGIYHTVLARRVLAGMSEVRNDLYWEDGVIKWTLARWYWFFVVTPVHVWAVWHYVHAHGSVVRQVSAGLLAAW